MSCWGREIARPDEPGLAGGKKPQQVWVNAPSLPIAKQWLTYGIIWAKKAGLYV